MKVPLEPAVRLGRFLWMIIAASIAVHVFSLVLARTMLQDWLWQDHPVHASVEMAGAVIALFVAGILIQLQKRGQGTSHNIWIAGALCGMGVLDGFHALTHAGNLFVWLHSTATFAGGVLFAFVWLPQRWGQRLGSRWPAAILTAALFFAVVSVAFPAYLPAMLESGEFTFWAKLLNIGGGLFLIAAAVALVLTWKKTRNPDDLLFCLHTTLFGTAAIMFEQSTLWDLPWWGWHLLRLMAFGVALWFVILTEQRAQAKFQQMAQELRLANQLLEQRVQERTSQLAQRTKDLELTESQLRRSNARLQEQMDELERFNRLSVGREERMIELKRQVNELALAQGKLAPYDLSLINNSGP